MPDISACQASLSFYLILYQISAKNARGNFHRNLGGNPEIFFETRLCKSGYGALCRNVPVKPGT